MLNQLPTQIKVQYLKARPCALTQMRNAVFEYSILEANGDVYGFAGGLLSKTQDGLWQVYYWEYAVGSPARTRKQAILNVLPLAAKIVADSRTQQEEYDKVYRDRQDFALQLAGRFSVLPGRTVSVHDTTAERGKPSLPAKFKVTITYDDLDQAKVEFLIGGAYGLL
jgi:hypothetical protein